LRIAELKNICKKAHRQKIKKILVVVIISIEHNVMQKKLIIVLYSFLKQLIYKENN